MSFYLGLDSSTQSLSAIIIDTDTKGIVYSDGLNFSAELGEKYGVKDGVIKGEGGQVHSLPLMWVECLDKLLERLKDNFDRVGEIKGISGSGQQHGTVYLNDTAAATLANLDVGSPLVAQLQSIFSRASAPVWMDSSTGEDCAAITAAIGAPMDVAAETGSIAVERFSGPQIKRFHRLEPEAYHATAHIGLVSSFMCSLLVGKFAPIDSGDGAGMNLMDLKGKTWSSKMLEATAPNLARKLPPVAPSHTVAGTVSSYLAERFGFAPDCEVNVFSGDNPNSLIGMGIVHPGQMAISLGTSDTNFCAISEARHDPDGLANVFMSPTGDYMVLSCFKNGSLARETIRQRFNMEWDEFSAILDSTPAGNDGKLLLPFYEPEIIPHTTVGGATYVDLAEDDKEGSVRAVVEAQMINMKYHSSWMGDKPTEIFATGGASKNTSILQIIADVFQATVYQFEVDNSAALGAALRAANATEDLDWKTLADDFCKRGTAIQPRPETAAAYEALSAKFGEAIKGLK